MNATLHDVWIAKILADGSTTVPLEPGTILPPAGRYRVDLWNAKGDLVANVLIKVGHAREAHIDNRQLSEGVHLVSDWQSLK